MVIGVPDNDQEPSPDEFDPDYEAEQANNNYEGENE